MGWQILRPLSVFRQTQLNAGIGESDAAQDNQEAGRVAGVLKAQGIEAVGASLISTNCAALRPILTDHPISLKCLVVARV